MQHIGILYEPTNSHGTCNFTINTYQQVQFRDVNQPKIIAIIKRAKQSR